MLEQLQKLEDRYNELEGLIVLPEVISDKNQYTAYARELAGLRDTVLMLREYKKACAEIEGLEAMLKEKHDREFTELARKEMADLEGKKAGLELSFKKIMTGVDKDANRNVIFEIRPGTGGLEAALFVADLYRMYTKYAANKDWVIEPMSVNASDLGGFKEVIFSVKGKEACKRLKFESGVHRVQRVPETEAQGRIHTSTATVAVLMEPQELDLVIEPRDLRIDTYRSSGPGGQHMQKTDSAVRITHLPTGIVVACQDERSQGKNKVKAMRILGARLLDVRQQEEARKISQARKSQIGTGDRSEKIRTYNFPGRRVTDHRINFTSHQLEAILEGGLDELSDALIEAEEEKRNEPRPS